MSSRISGVFPGGPSRSAQALRVTAHAPIRGVAERTARERSAARARSRLERSKRRLVGTLLAMAAAAAVGFTAGRGLGGETPQARPATASDALDRAISSEVNRVLLELWRMEDVERLGVRRAVP